MFLLVAVFNEAPRVTDYEILVTRLRKNTYELYLATKILSEIYQTV